MKTSILLRCTLHAMSRLDLCVFEARHSLRQIRYFIRWHPNRYGFSRAAWYRDRAIRYVAEGKAARAELRKDFKQLLRKPRLASAL